MSDPLENGIKRWVARSDPPVTPEEARSRAHDAVGPGRRAPVLLTAALVVAVGVALAVWLVSETPETELRTTTDGDRPSPTAPAESPLPEDIGDNHPAQVHAELEDQVGRLAITHVSGRTLTISADADLLDADIWVRPFLRLRHPDHPDSKLGLSLFHADASAVLHSLCADTTKDWPIEARCAEPVEQAVTDEVSEWSISTEQAGNLRDYDYSVLDFGEDWVILLDRREGDHAETLATGLDIEVGIDGFPTVTAVGDVELETDLSGISIWLLYPDGEITFLRVSPTCDVVDTGRVAPGERTGNHYTCLGDGAAVVNDWPTDYASAARSPSVPAEWESLTIDMD